MTTSYDAVLYPPRPFVQTHPDRLATLATLFGLPAAPPATCRVLELGCGVGGNLLPMAAALPEATFVGLDNAAVPIARARELAARAGLTNITFEETGLESYDGEGFDYVIAHGVFSWVPEPVRDALLSLLGRALTENGVAYVSYNALPGGHLRLMLREALAVHLGEIEDPAARIAAAREFLRALSETEDEVAPTLRRAAQEVVGNDDAFLFHDVLAPENRPFALREFLDRAYAHGLRYLTEAQYSETQRGALPAEIDAIEDPIAREEHLDLYKERRFRQTLLCRADRPLYPAPHPETLRGLGVSGALRVQSDGARVTFLGPGTARIETDNRLVIRTLQRIAVAWPSAVWIADLGEEAELPQIRAALLQCYAANLVRLHVAPPFASTSVPDRPAVSAVARLEAEEGQPLTTIRHTAHDPGEHRAVVPLLDGTRDRADLDAAALEHLAAAGLLLPG